MRRFPLWIVDANDIIGPVVKQYEATELRKTGAAVVVRGFSKFIVHAKDRTFHTDLDSLRKCVLAMFDRYERLYEERLAKIRERRTKFEIDIEPAAPAKHIDFKLE